MFSQASVCSRGRVPACACVGMYNIMHMDKGCGIEGMCYRGGVWYRRGVWCGGYVWYRRGVWPRGVFPEWGLQGVSGRRMCLPRGGLGVHP